MPNLPRGIVTEFNGGVNSYFDDYTLPRAGTYKIQIATQWRYQKGRYRMELKGPVQNLRQEVAPRWVEQELTFGEEGGGGANNNFFSPRNHHYVFEPEEGTVLDINAEANGLPIQVSLVNPAGSINGGMNGGEPGLHYVVAKADQKGVYHIWVATVEPNAKAKYKLEVMGKLKTAPKRLDSKFSSQKGQFTATSKRQEYTISAQQSILEIIYRSANAEASSIRVYDKNGAEIAPHYDNSPTSRLINRSYVLKEAGSCKLILETQQPTAGEYELLAWGSFDGITRQQINTPGTRTQPQAPAKPTVATTFPASYSALMQTGITQFRAQAYNDALSNFNSALVLMNRKDTVSSLYAGITASKLEDNEKTKNYLYAYVEGGGRDKSAVESLLFLYKQSAETDKVNEVIRLINTPVVSAKPTNTFQYRGRIIDRKTKTVPSGTVILYEDLNTGEVLGQTNVDGQTGDYVLELPYGRRYGITAKAEGFVASSVSLDLNKPGSKPIVKSTDLYVAPVEAGTTVRLNNLFFATAKSNLLPESYAELNRIATFLTNNGSVAIEIAGHTDNIGNDQTNVVLSQDRADAVRYYLQSKGIPVNRLNAKGYGKTRPVTTNATEDGKAQNRRVEFVILRN